ncbi:hypothetical protein D1007_39251 [Hordeum vulgare]|nr:hypothetical protein D1007_39251 [Hordeum vulgare]
MTRSAHLRCHNREDTNATHHNTSRHPHDQEAQPPLCHPYTRTPVESLSSSPPPEATASTSLSEPLTDGIACGRRRPKGRRHLPSGSHHKANGHSRAAPPPWLPNELPVHEGGGIPKPCTSARAPATCLQNLWTDRQLVLLQDLAPPDLNRELPRNRHFRSSGSLGIAGRILL